MSLDICIVCVRFKIEFYLLIKYLLFLFTYLTYFMLIMYFYSKASPHERWNALHNEGDDFIQADTVGKLFINAECFKEKEENLGLMEATS